MSKEPILCYINSEKLSWAVLVSYLVLLQELKQQGILEDIMQLLVNVTGHGCSLHWLESVVPVKLSSWMF